MTTAERIIKSIEDFINGSPYTDWYIGHKNASHSTLINDHMDYGMFVVLPEDEEIVLRYFLNKGMKPDGKYTTNAHMSVFIYRE